ncbi:MAG: hypothetical protein MUF54_13645 [Polyangiaceae bacterium]|nr:hypothetical protein [Polyangiaceae bacterium]
MEPGSSDNDEMHTEVRRLAHKHAVQAHAIHMKTVAGEQHLELHLEVPAQLKVDEAHALATAFEQEVARAIPSLSKVVTHLEPVGEQAGCPDAELADATRIRAVLDQMARSAGRVWSPQDVVVTRVDGQLEVAFSCKVDGSENICTAHAVTESVEKQLRARMPGLGKVVIHVEPRTQ